MKRERLLAGGIGALLLACGGDKSLATAAVHITLQQQIKSLVVAPPTATTIVNHAVKFTVTILDANGGFVSNRAVAWTVSNAAIGAIDSNGSFIGSAAGVDTVYVRASEGPQGMAVVTTVLP